METQKIETLYSSTPHWSWWVAHAIFGMTLGLISSLWLRWSNRERAEPATAAS